MKITQLKEIIENKSAYIIYHELFIQTFTQGLDEILLNTYLLLKIIKINI